MNSKLYRCGYCGTPTTDQGMPLESEVFKRVVNLIEVYGDGRTHKTHGECCVYGQKQQDEMVQITRDMAIDAGDRDLEGQWIKW